MRLPADLEAAILSTPGVVVGGAKPDIGNPITEKAFQRAIIEEAIRNGWTYYHTYDSRKSAAGFPDLVLVRERVLWMEVKTEDGKASAAQSSWGEILLAAGQDYRLVRPSDWPTIVETLK
jgi:hypothetical protein